MLNKRVNDVLDFDFDFTDWLLARGDSISSSSVIAPGLIVGNITENLGVVKVFISGGSKNTKYNITCKIITVGGRTKEVVSPIHVVG